MQQNGPDFIRSDNVNGQTTRQKSSKKTGLAFRAGGTSGHSRRRVFMNEQVCEQLTLFQVDFHANRLASPGSKKEKTTNATYGLKCSGSQGRSGQSGLLGKMFLDLFEERLTKSLKVSKAKATPRGHTLSRLVRLEPRSLEKESLLWPRPTTGAPLCGGTHNFNQMIALRDAGIITEEERRNLTQGNGGRSNPALMEWLMGFPIGWTGLDASETP